MTFQFFRFLKTSRKIKSHIFLILEFRKSHKETHFAENRKSPVKIYPESLACSFKICGFVGFGNTTRASLISLRLLTRTAED